MRKYVHAYKVSLLKKHKRYFFGLCIKTLADADIYVHVYKVGVLKCPTLFGLCIKTYSTLSDCCLLNTTLLERSLIAPPMIISGLTNPGSECLNFKAMHDGVKSQKEKCTKVPSLDSTIEDETVETWLEMDNACFVTLCLCLREEEGQPSFETLGSNLQIVPKLGCFFSSLSW